MFKKYINDNSMYSIVLNALVAIILGAFLFATFGWVSLNAWNLLLSLFVILSVGFVSNYTLGKIFKVHVNRESSIIASLVLFCILVPAKSPRELLILALVSLLAQLSKYAFVWNRIHIFNPAAVGAFMATLIFNYPVTWWVSSKVMLPLVALAGLTVVMKTGRKYMVAVFFVVAYLTLILNYGDSIPFLNLSKQFFTAWPTVFFATIMLTEPLTMPNIKRFQIGYAVFIGLLFGMTFNIGPIFSTPELVLLIGNLAVFVLKPRSRYILSLKEIKTLNPETKEFVFNTDKKINFKAGQYMELEVPHKHADSRGLRRYFTISSSPQQKETSFGIKFNKGGSSYKNALSKIKVGEEIYATQLGGDFVLKNNSDKSSNYVFIAGGVGITPFISMIRNLIDKPTGANVTLFYTVRRVKDIAYRELLELAASSKVINLFYVVTDEQSLIDDKNFIYGTLYPIKIINNVKNALSANYFISGPPAMVGHFAANLKKNGVSGNKIHTDFFPGF